MKKRAIFIIPLVITAIISVFLDYTLFNVWDIVLRFAIFYAIGLIIMLILNWYIKGEEEIDKEKEEERNDAYVKLCCFKYIVGQINEDRDKLTIDFIKMVMGELELVSINNPMGISHYKFENKYNKYDFYFKNNKLHNVGYLKCKNF